MVMLASHKTLSPSLVPATYFASLRLVERMACSINQASILTAVWQF